MSGDADDVTPRPYHSRLVIGHGPVKPVRSVRGSDIHWCAGAAQGCH